MFSDFIKHYDNIRFILKEIFLYGCYSRGDLEKKTSSSSRKVSYEIRRIQQYIEKEFIKSDWEGRNKLLSLSYDSLSNNKNFLVGTFGGKSFTKIDLRLYFYILMIFSESEEEITFSDIEDTLIDNELISYDEVSSKTIQRKVKELSEEIGIIRWRKEGRTKLYKTDDDILEDLSASEIEQVYSVIALYKNILFPNIAGYYCEDTIKEYISYKLHKNISFDDNFQYRNLHFHPLIDEEVLWKIIMALNSGHKIQTTSIVNKGRNNKSKKMEPHAIRYDVNRGRVYITGFTDKNRCASVRVDKIKEIKILNETFDRKDNKEKYVDAMKYSWSSVPCNHVHGPQQLEVQFSYNKETEGYLLEKIKMELSPDSISESSEGKLVFKKKVNDCWEMIPWIRSYAGNLKVIKPTWLSQRIQHDWKEMLESYGTIS